MRAETTLPCTPRSAAAARSWARELCLSTRAAPLCEDVAVVVSELVTNAVVHARSEVTLVLHIKARGTVRIEVSDNDTRPPRIDPPDDASLGGRGLHLIAAMAAEHGWFLTDRGKTVWAELTVRRSR